MAIVAGDEVALIRDPGDATLEARGAVLFGIAIAVSGSVDVVWENGQVAEAVPMASLDKIVGFTPPDGAKAVVFTDAEGGAQLSTEYTCVTVRGYSRQPGGAGNAVDFILMRSIATGQFYEALASVVEAVPGV